MHLLFAQLKYNRIFGENYITMETETYYLHMQNGIIVIQESKYLEHGWFVYIENNIISLKEIPYGGGQEIHIGTYASIEEAIIAGKSLV